MSTKPAYKTPAFIATAVATLLGLTLASGLVLPDHTAAHVVGWVLTILSTLGYKPWAPVPAPQTFAGDTLGGGKGG